VKLAGQESHKRACQNPSPTPVHAALHHVGLRSDKSVSRETGSSSATVKSAYAAAKPEARGGGARVQGDIEPWRISVYGYYDHRTMRRMDAA
jgi:hypothetical protein